MHLAYCDRRVMRNTFEDGGMDDVVGTRHIHHRARAVSRMA